MNARSVQETLPAVVDARRFVAVVFDMDGVLTDTARVHFAAWKLLFDEALAHLTSGIAAKPFEFDDYLRFVDGRSRIDGVMAVLDARAVHLRTGASSDVAGDATAWALANRKDELFLRALQKDGVHAFATSVDFVRAVRAAGLATAVVTASAHRTDVLAAAGLDGMFDAHVDGVDASELGLAGKPAPDMFLAAAARLAVDPGSAVVIEDAVAGVAAGRRGGFGLVVGVNRTGSASVLAAGGADLVVGDLAELRIVGPRSGRR
jgi:alpha,alpha-trehalase